MKVSVLLSALGLAVSAQYGHANNANSFWEQAVPDALVKQELELQQQQNTENLRHRELQFTDGERMVFLGDSWGFFATQLQGNNADFSIRSGFCDNGVGVRVVNEGVAGATALDWATKQRSCAVGLSGWLQNGCNVDTIIRDETTFNKVWLTVGGNDFFDNQCRGSTTVKANVQTVVNQILSINPNMKILITGYSPPSCTPDFDGCVPETLPNFVNTVQRELQEIANENAAVTWVSVYDLFPGGNPPFSDDAMYRDCIHMNRDGYARFFNVPAIKNFICGNGGSNPNPPTPFPTPNPTPNPTPRPVAPVPNPPNNCVDVNPTCLRFNNQDDAPCESISSEYCTQDNVRLRCTKLCNSCTEGPGVDKVPCSLRYRDGCPALCKDLGQYCTRTGNRAFDILREECQKTCPPRNGRLLEFHTPVDKRNLQEEDFTLPEDVAAPSNPGGNILQALPEKAGSQDVAADSLLIGVIAGVASLFSLTVLAAGYMQYRRAKLLERSLHTIKTGSVVESTVSIPDRKVSL